MAVCSEFFDRDITEDELINILSSYDKKDDDGSEQKDVKKYSFLEDVVDFLISYYIEIIIVIVFCEYFFCVCWLHWWRKKGI